MSINPKCENAIAFQIKMDFATIRGSDGPWKPNTGGELFKIGRHEKRGGCWEN